ncbi:MAG TPA: DUF3365 domain-containing protein [Pseudomonas sp.]|nr:DUF3365 domain-containing protein [Pseudomonas sp.]
MRLAILALLTGLGSHAVAADTQQLAAEGAALIPPFQQQLLETVKAAMQAGGPAKAVESCQLLAPQIAAQHSQAPWKIGRTALKVRNPANAPDAWERTVLERFAARAAAGEPVAGLQHAEVVNGEFRLMKAIPTGEPCLACHGQQIKPELAAVIDQRYPQDQARGFALGELRGAFTLRRALDE